MCDILYSMCFKTLIMVLILFIVYVKLYLLVGAHSPIECTYINRMDASTPVKDDESESGGRRTGNRTQSLSFSVGDVTDLPDEENMTRFSVTTVLNYCKTKILKPYLRLLSITGLRSFSSDQSEYLTVTDIFSVLYILILLLLMGVGYVLQYMACFRRDRGFGYILSDSNGSGPFQILEHNTMYESVCNDSVAFCYIMPDVFQFLGYMYAFFVFRSSDDDQLPSLMETVFLSLSNLSNGFQSQRRLVRTLWIFVSVSLLWMVLSFITVNVMMGEGIIEFKWVSRRSSALLISLKVLLVVSTLWHDVIQATVISNYCLQAQLLTSYIHFLKVKMLEHSIPPLEWMKDIEEFKKLLKFLNQKLAPAVCLFTLINVCRGITGTLWLFDLDRIDKDNACVVGINVLNVCLWIVISIAPFLQAARLTNSCEVVRGVGHETRIRPFAHQDTPGHKLDSLMLYASSLRLKAKLFGIPIRSCYLYFTLTFSVVSVIVLGQLHYFKGSL